jgi:ABC-2 type transport system ATP-binding protein
MSSVVVRDLRKTYGTVEAVRGLSFEVAPGECFGLLGPNGAGKTTTIEILEGLLAPTGGEVVVLGRRWGQDDQAIRERMGVCLQQTVLSEKLQVDETVDLFRRFHRRGRAPEAVIREVELTEKAKARVGTLSGGQKQRLAVACALVGDPELLFLDEPTTGLDPQSRRQVWDIVNAFKAGGRTVLLTTHYMDEAERLSDALTVLARGRVVARGTAKTVLGDLVGEHVVVVDAGQGAAVAAWLAARGRGEPASVLGDLHLPLSGEELAEFARAFPALRYEVRGPTLDDLFLKLSLAP